MDKELYFGVDVSKKTLDLAYYDGETIDLKKAHAGASEKEGTPDGGSELFCRRKQRPFPDLVSPA